MDLDNKFFFALKEPSNQVTKKLKLFWDRGERNAWKILNPWAMESLVPMESGGTMLIHQILKKGGSKQAYPILQLRYPAQLQTSYKVVNHIGVI